MKCGLAPRSGSEVETMKQYLVVKVERPSGVPANVTPISGIYNRPAAEQMVLRLQDEDPDSAFFIQEVGAA